MPESVELNRLAREWENLSHPGMAALYRRVLAIKSQESYEETLDRVASGKIHRHVENSEYVASLLVLLDDRQVSIVDLQGVIGLQPGHLFRTLKRAGVWFQALSGKAA